MNSHNEGGSKEEVGVEPWGLERKRGSSLTWRAVSLHRLSMTDPSLKRCWMNRKRQC